MNVVTVSSRIKLGNLSLFTGHDPRARVGIKVARACSSKAQTTTPTPPQLEKKGGRKAQLISLLNSWEWREKSVVDHIIKLCFDPVPSTPLNMLNRAWRNARAGL